MNGAEEERGENREGNGMGNGWVGLTGTETDRERQKGRHVGARRTTGIGSEKAAVGG